MLMYMSTVFSDLFYFNVQPEYRCTIVVKKVMLYILYVKINYIKKDSTCTLDRRNSHVVLHVNLSLTCIIIIISYSS